MPQPADAPYPGAEALRADARMLCQGSIYEAYVGRAYTDGSRFFVYALAPTEESWATGDRDGPCVLDDVAGPRTESAQGSGL